MFPYRTGPVSHMDHGTFFCILGGKTSRGETGWETVGFFSSGRSSEVVGCEGYEVDPTALPGSFFGQIG